jgi:uncharacterized membrane protein (UPF0127 family)
MARESARRSAFLFILAFLAWPLAAGRAPAAEQGTLEIVTKSGVRTFAVELAVTEDERAKGLMFRKEVPEGYGMLFDFKQEQPVSMWMKNTFVPLDMIFIKNDGRIARIAENTKVQSEDIISSGPPVRAVLEVVAGTAKKLGIAAGDKVAYPLFNGR